MKFPDAPSSLQGLPQFCRDLRNFLRAGKLRSSPSVSVSETANGTTLTVNFSPTTPGAPTVSKPFQLYNASTATEDDPPVITLKVGITPGTVNSISPTYEGADPAGELEDVPPPVLTITETTYFYAYVVGTFGTPDSYVVTVENNTTGEPPESSIDGTEFKSAYLIGIAIVDDSEDPPTMTFTQNADSNMQVESFGSTNYWWAVP